MKYSEFFKLLEKKDHLINKLTTLSPEQKQEAIDFFTEHPTYENEINWNKKDLAWKDFENVFNKERISKSQISNFVKDGKHYLTLYKGDGVTVYQPLTYVGSRYLASDEVAPYVEGKWCIAYQKEKSHWNSYSIDDMNAFLFICTEDTKYALQINSDDFPSSTSSLIETLKDSLYDKYYNSACMDLYDEYKDLVDAGEIDPEEYSDDDYIDSQLEDYMEIKISSIFNGNFRDMIYYLLSNEILTVWDAEDNSLFSNEALSCLENLQGITLEQLFKLCQEAVSNMYIVFDMQDEDEAISKQMEQLRIEAIRKEFWNLYKKSQKKRIPFVYKHDLTSDVIFDIDSNIDSTGFLKKDSEGTEVGFNVKIDKLKGSVNLYDMCFEGIENFPTEVTGNFTVWLGKSVTKLENCPRIVGGNFDIRYSHLQTLEGSPEYVGGDFICGGSHSIKSLEALKGAPAQVDGIFKVVITSNRDLAIDILNKLGLINKDETITHSRIVTILHYNLPTIKNLITDFLEKNGTKIGKHVMLL